MKKPTTSKPKPSWSPPPLSVPRDPTQVAALRILTRALNDQDDGRVVGRLMSLGLYVLGLDPAGDFCSDELTDALYGEGEESRLVNQTITDAGHEAETAWSNHEREERTRTYRKFYAVGGAA